MNTNGATHSPPFPAPPGGDLRRLLLVVQLCDSALPVGAYCHSWGLEAAVERGQVRDILALESWARFWLRHVVAPGDGVAVAHAARAAAEDDAEALAGLNDLLTASKPAPSLRRASRRQGDALLALASGWPWSGRLAAVLAGAGARSWNHPVVFGALCHAAGLPAVEAVGLYLQNAAAGLTAAAVRAVPVGHTHGQQLLARLQPLLTELAVRHADVPPSCLGGLSPAYEVLAHAQTELYTRIFQS